MPITEIPPSPPTQSSPPPEGPFRRRRANYENLEPEELFHVIDDLEGSKTRGRIREFIWISIIAHMIVFWYLAYGPRYFRGVQVLDPSDKIKQQKDMTYLDLPEALKKIKPKDSKIISDQNRTAETKKPTIDKKTLEQLQAMRKAGPPVPQPAPQPAPPSQQPPTPQVAQQQPQPQPEQQPLKDNQLSQLETPKPKLAPTNPSFNTGPTTPGEAIRQAARDAARSPTVFGGDSGASAPPGNSGSAGGAEILSDTMGVDFGPYMKRIIYDTERSWWPIIPEVARPPPQQAGKSDDSLQNHEGRQREGDDS